MTVMTAAKIPATFTWQAAGMASLLEALLVLAVLSATHTVPPATQTFTPLVIEPVTEELKPPVIEPELPKPVLPVKAVIEPVRPVPVKHQAEVTAPVIDPLPERKSEPESAQVVAESKAPAPQETVVAPKVESEDPSIAYNAALTMAVQARFQVPAAAVTLGFKGRARVEFKLQDGKVSAIRVIQSSTLGVVDRAALRAVAEASYPSPPVALAGIMGIYQIWVECR